MSMGLVEATRPAAAALGIVDCDIHPSFGSPATLAPFMTERWYKHWREYGAHLRQGLSATLAHPRMSPGVARADAWPPNGGPPGSDLDFMRTHHLDAHGIAHGMLMCLRPGGADERNLELGAALCRATNDWQIAAWVTPEPRLSAGITITQEDPVAAVAEIARCAGNPAFKVINMPPRTDEPAGRRRYWPIYEAAQAAGLPIGMHIAGVPGHPSTGAGWPSFYMQEHHANAQSMQAVVTSLIMEGVPERFPGLTFVLVECGFAWAPSLGWRLDKLWQRMRGEVPQVKRPPSEYLRECFCYTTQPIEEPERPEHLRDIIDWVGWDRLLFSTDYPHWDFDDPRYTFRIALSAAERQAGFQESYLREALLRAGWLVEKHVCPLTRRGTSWIGRKMGHSFRVQDTELPALPGSTWFGREATGRWTGETAELPLPTAMGYTNIAIDITNHGPTPVPVRLTASGTSLVKTIGPTQTVTFGLPVAPGTGRLRISAPGFVPDSFLGNGDTRTLGVFVSEVRFS